MREARSELVRRIASALKARRRALGLTQEQLAARMGTGWKNLQRFETGQNLKLETLERLAQALDTTASALLAEPTSASGEADRLAPPLSRLQAAGYPVRRPNEPGRRPNGAVAVTTLRAIAGQPEQGGRITELLGWVVLPRHSEAPTGQFVAEIEGRSMEPKIPQGSLCLFGPAGSPPYGTRVFLLGLGGLVDDPSSPSFTLKRIQSVRTLTNGRTRVVLESINKAVKPIALETYGDDDLRVVAELREVLV